MINKTKLIFRIISVLLLLIGGIGLSGPWLINSNIIEYNKEIPLGDVKGILVDDSGQIYIGEGFYDRIQIYDSNGNFMRHWKIDVKGGDFKMYLNDDQTLSVIVARGGKQIVYNQFGKRISKTKIKKKYDDYEFISNEYTSALGKHYKVSGWMFKEIINADENKALVQQGFLSSIFKGRTLSLFFWAIGLGIHMRYNSRIFSKVRSKRAQPH